MQIELAVFLHISLMQRGETAQITRIHRYAELRTGRRILQNESRIVSISRE